MWMIAEGFVRENPEENDTAVKNGENKKREEVSRNANRVQRPSGKMKYWKKKIYL